MDNIILETCVAKYTFDDEFAEVECSNAVLNLPFCIYAVISPTTTYNRLKLKLALMTIPYKGTNAGTSSFYN